MHRSTGGVAARMRAIRIGSALLLATLVLLPTLAAAEPASRSDLRGASTAPPLEHHGNISGNLPSSAGVGAPGALVTLDLEAHLTNAGISTATVSVVVPPILGELPTTSGERMLYFRPLNLTVNGSSGSEGVLGPATRFSTGYVLQSNATGLVSSQGLALEAGDLPPGSEIAMSWRWSFLSPNGSTSYGPWSSPQVIAPPIPATPGGSWGTNWVLGSAYPVCLSGAIGGRSFTLRVIIADPPSTIALPTVSVPIGFEDLCWNSTLPGGISPQPASLHLWEVTNVTYLLAASDIQLVATGSRGGTAAAPGPLLGIGVWLLVALIAGGALIALEVVFLLRRAATPVPAGGPPTGAGFVGAADAPRSDPAGTDRPAP